MKPMEKLTFIVFLLRQFLPKAGDFVFGNRGNREQTLLSDYLLDQYSLGSVPKDKRKPNSHLSLLAMVDCWYQLKMNPYSHMVCRMPLFRFWL